KKHKIYLYKEDFTAFAEILNEMMQFVVDTKGEEVISERHQKDFKKEEDASSADENQSSSSFTDLDFEEL
ncbi:MAG: DUF3276 family protein, partial [Flavobacteriaceae bacterium]